MVFFDKKLKFKIVTIILVTQQLPIKYLIVSGDVIVSIYSIITMKDIKLSINSFAVPMLPRPTH